jgi:HD-GYP domain-containing protein (c-di-GMP phosphodiesterase class II)/DNA-binding protein H-NS
MTRDISNLEIEQSEVLKDLMSISSILSGERNLDTLSTKIVQLARKITGSDGGTLYSINSSEDSLVFEYIETDSLNIQMGGCSGNKIEWRNLPMYIYDNDLNKIKNTTMVAVKCALEKEIINIKDIYTDSNFNFKGTKAFDKSNNYRSDSMLVIPLLDHEDEIIGVLQLLNKKDELKNNIKFSEFDEEIAKALAAQVGIVMQNTILIAELEEFMEQFIKSVSTAIDKKSPFTGGHIKQVEKVSILLAQAVSKDKKYFENIKYDESDYKLFKLASWLHDIGKISIPEHIIDKSTKLETVFDKIHTIKERIEVIKRDIKIKMLNKKIELLEKNNPREIEAIEQKYQQETNQLNSYFETLKKVNIGSEFLDEDSKQKIKKIANLKYRINGETFKLIRDEELEDLLISRGTLNEKEREIIQDHAMMTYNMLKDLPFPKKYQKIVNMASNHHETLNGKGYPRKLTENQLSIEDRIIAVADIFEALTSKDRPYKQPKKLSEVVKILTFMIKDKHLDERLIRVLFEEKAYLNYLGELCKFQIDVENPEINI